MHLFCAPTTRKDPLPVLVLAALLPLLVFGGGLYEPDRVAEYAKRNHTWPPRDDEYLPGTDGWRTVMRRRFEQVRRIEDRGDMYNGRTRASRRR